MTNIPKVDRNTRRRQATDEKIAEAVLRIAIEQAPQAVTFSEVSKTSGVAKTTLYRRYHDRRDMLAAALDQFTWIPTYVDDAPLTQAGMVATLRQGVEFIENRLGTRAIGRLLSGDDEFLQELRARVMSPQTEAVQAYFHRGVIAGVLRPDLDYSVLVDVVIGGMIFRRARDGGIEQRWSDEVGAIIWPLIAKDTNSNTS